MIWNWQKPDWPEFSWNQARLRRAEEAFLVGSGVLVGAVRHLDGGTRQQLTIELISTEALTTSEIEGEHLDRTSVQSSVRKELGMTVSTKRAPAAEQGIAEMMTDLYRSFAQPLTDDTLFNWHRSALGSRRDIQDIGRYRTAGGAMQVVSGPIHGPRVHFEAPPASGLHKRMAGFLDWFGRTGPLGADPLPALTRAGIAHLYFESLHPFEDGNGRIGRAISEKAMAQCVGRPTLTTLAGTILVRRKAYYAALASASRSNEISEWLAWFAGIALEAQRRTEARIQFLIDKTKLLDRLRGQLSERQEKAILRMLREGPEGFRGGLSSGNYQRITGTSSATSTRDLADLVAKGALTRNGARRYARYHLAIVLRPVRSVTVGKRGELN